MVEDCKALVWSCPRCHTFEGAIPKATLCPIRAHTPLELVHVDVTSVESTTELNKPPSIKNILVMMDTFTRYALAVVMKDQTANGIQHACKTSKRPRGKLHIGASRGVVRRIRHSEVLDYHVPPTVQWTCLLYTSDAADE